LSISKRYLEVVDMDISIAEAHNRLSHWLKQVEQGKIVRITKRGKPVGVIIDPDEYAKLRQVQAYLEMVSLARVLRESNVTASELYQAGRDELEQRA
jgi:prevent-host-death family protein